MLQAESRCNNTMQRVYYKHTAVGTFWIRPDNVHGWSLFIDEDGNVELLGSYSSPEAAADDVYTQHTGWNEWDIPNRPDVPTDLGEWTLATAS
jgi:hypothetical protein